METHALKEIGLSDGEIRIYFSVLDMGISTLGAIHEKTGIERRNIYDILNKLIEKGLVSYMVEKRRKSYQCVNPTVLLERIKKKEDALMQLEKQIPELLRTYHSSKPKITAEIYRGKSGIKAVFEDMLNFKENYFIGSGWYVAKNLPFYWAGYNKRRIQRGVKWYNLVRHELKMTKMPETRLISTKFLPEEFSASPMVVFIYGNKVVNVLWSEGFFAFMIESKAVAENYKKYHKYLWDKVAESS